MTTKEVDHYSDRYWNDLAVVREHLCRLATGDRSVWWPIHLKTRYATPPRERALIIACGNGWVERELHDLEIARHFDAFDPNPGYLEQAHELKGDRSIDYFQATFSDFPLDRDYDLIVNVAALHHARYLYRTLERLARALVPHGLLVNFDYVGPSRNQYSSKHLDHMVRANRSLPEAFRTPHSLVPPLQTMVREDPTEAVHSEEVLPAMELYFETVERHDLGGGLAYQILWNNIEPFADETDERAQRELERLLTLDWELTRTREIPTLFTYLLARPRSGGVPLRARYARWIKEPAREALSRTLLGDFYPGEILRRRRKIQPGESS